MTYKATGWVAEKDSFASNAKVSSKAFYEPEYFQVQLRGKGI